MEPQDFFDSNFIFFLENVKTSSDVLTFLGNKLVENNIVIPTYVDSILDREQKFPTGLAVEYINIAIPHAEIQFIKQDRIAVAILHEAVNFCEMSTNEIIPVKLVFMLALSDNQKHLNAIETIITLVEDQSFVHTMIASNNALEISDLIKDKITS